MVLTSSQTESGNRVWIKQSAIDSVRNPKLPFKERVSRKPSSSLNSSFSTFSRQYSSFASTGSVASVASSFRDLDNESDVGSVGNFSVGLRASRNQEWGWKSGYITQSSRDCITVCLDEDGPESMNDPVQLAASALSQGDIVMGNTYGVPVCPHDLITLTHLHEPAVVESLESRYSEDQIYTATGPVLLAVNPFHAIRGMYGESTMRKYWDRAESNAKEDLPPHVYAIADDAFRSMMRRLDETICDAEPVGCDQSILVSGESGAGKTVTTKFVMKYLAALSQRAGNTPKDKRAYEKVADKRQSNMPGAWNQLKEQPDLDKGLSSVTALSGAGSVNSIEAQVLQSNPILESFGNARTVRNDNSSRFGKFIEIQFTRMGRLVGAQIETYLLEKVRLVTQSLGERNYHIFYELLSGAMPPNELRNYFIASTATPDDFKMTASGTYNRRDGITDKETFHALLAAMETMKFSNDEQRNIFATAAALLHASNLTFKDFDTECALDERNVHLQPVCHLLGVSPKDLNQALCHFSITAGRDSLVKRSLNVDGATKGLEALLKATYGALFDYLVSRINDSISFQKDPSMDGEGSHASNPATDPVASIGVLDIFGFESFQTNSFEQLCINYCNEALQQQFNAFVLRNEQAEYEREGINWSFIEFPENQDVIDLIDKRGSGILGILDDQCRAPGTSDKSFALDVYKKCKNHSRFSACRKQTASLEFSVHHYAGPVEYTTDGFIEKNRDELPKEATDLLQNSRNPFIQMLAEIIELAGSERASNNRDTPARLRRQDSVMARITVGGQFRRQLKNLREKIDEMSPHYIRCLKPNDELVADRFNRAAVAEQLRCGGILEAVRVARAGFSNHYPHEDFLRRYRCLAFQEIESSRTQPKWESPVDNYRNNNNYRRSIGVRTPSLNSDTKVKCRDLITVLYAKIKADIGMEENNSENEHCGSGNVQPMHETPLVNNKEPPTPSWGRDAAVKPGLPPRNTPARSSRAAAWEKKVAESRSSFSPVPSKPVSSHHTVGPTASDTDLAKAGIQVGKTKVFLRHTVFEALERLRSQELGRAATTINAICRMFLARRAYVHVRNMVRHSMHELIRFESEYRKSKEQDVEDSDSHFAQLLRLRNSYCGEQPSLVEVWATQIRSGIHNPVPRHEWGRQSPNGEFKWMLVDGLWVKNQIPLAIEQS